jgi:hypothetical protein
MNSLGFAHFSIAILADFSFGTVFLDSILRGILCNRKLENSFYVYFILFLEQNELQGL